MKDTNNAHDNIEVVFTRPRSQQVLTFDRRQPEKNQVSLTKNASFGTASASTTSTSTDQSSVFLEADLSTIPGSPYAKPLIRRSTRHHPIKKSRPTKPLGLATYASALGLTLSTAWCGYLLFVSAWYYSSFGHVIVQIFLTILTFFGVFWNTYFTASSVFKCFIPKHCFRENGKYLSVIPEEKHPSDDWIPVTIQIPVYKESLAEVIGPTLLSSIAARDHYIKHTYAECNIVVCDDGIMPMLGDSMIVAEALWQLVREQHGYTRNLQEHMKEMPHEVSVQVAGLNEQDIHEVFDRMLFYYHHDVGFVARSAHDRPGKFKKASNLNSHLRLVFGARQVVEESSNSFDQALWDTAHDQEGERAIMYGNNVDIGDIIIINDADARMAQQVILKTVPEFLNDQTLGFTQHATKIMDDQRDASHFLKLLGVYTDALYQGHFMLSSIMGCHPPLVGHSVMIRTDAIRQCARMRSLKKGQNWLKNVGLHFLEVSHIGYQNLHRPDALEYWSHHHVSEDFELMIHLYNMGYDGRYVAFPDCEFQEGVTRTFDEEAARHRKFSLGSHELMFSPLNDFCGHGFFTPTFRTFLRCDIPSYYKIYLVAYLLSYVTGGIYFFVFVIAAIVKMVNFSDAGAIFATTPAAVLILNIFVYYIIGYFAFLIALTRMFRANKKLFFPEYRELSSVSLGYKMVRHAMLFQFSFYTVMGNYFFLGGLDHMLSRDYLIGVTNKDTIRISRCEALKELIKFNSDSWFIGTISMCLGVVTVVLDTGITQTPTVGSILFAGPMIILGIMSFIVPFTLNPYVIGNRAGTVRREEENKKLRSDATFDEELLTTRSSTSFVVETENDELS